MHSVELPGCGILVKSFSLPALPCSELFNLPLSSVGAGDGVQDTV